MTTCLSLHNVSPENAIAAPVAMPHAPILTFVLASEPSDVPMFHPTLRTAGNAGMLALSCQMDSRLAQKECARLAQQVLRFFMAIHSC